MQAAPHRPPAALPGWRPLPVAAIRPAKLPACSSSKQPYDLLQERGVAFTPGDAFYRAESAQGRDLAVLAAAVYKQQHGQLRVLDVMAGSGMRGARYIQQAGADLVWCNDYDRRNNAALVFNLVNALNHGGSSSSSSQQDALPQGNPDICHSSSSSSSSSSSRSGTGAVGIEACAGQWTAAAESIKYEGIRGNILQWQQPAQQQQHQQRQEPVQQQVLQQQQPQQDKQQQLAHHHQQQEHRYVLHQQPHPQPQQQAQRQDHEQRQPPDHQQEQQQDHHHHQYQKHQQQQRSVRVTHVEARRLLASVYLQEDYFDLVDVDSFGSDTSYLPAAIDALKYGGMLYLTSTDGISAGGKRPQRSLASYGAYLRALPSANEQGLRMLIGAAVREGAARGVKLTPLFSLYSYHGPVFRVMLRASRSKQELDVQQLSYVGHCYVHGESYRVGWRGLSQAWCRCVPQPATSQDAGVAATAGGVPPGGGAAAAAGGGQRQACRPTPLVLSGPMWTGPLHDAEFVASMSQLATEWGWRGSGVPPDSPYGVRQSKNNRQRPLDDLLDLLVAESDPRLPPWFTCIDTLAQHLTTTPRRDALVSALQARGYAACCCHVEHRALRSNATTAQVLQVAVADCGYSLRPGGQPGVPQVLLQHHEVQGLDDLI